MGTMVKMYIHVLLVDIHESPLFRKFELDFINKTINCSNALLISDIIRPSTCTCNSLEQKQLVLQTSQSSHIYIHGILTNSRDPDQISQNVVSDQETLEYMLHVRSLSSIILIRKCHNHRIIAFHLTTNTYLYIF